MGSEDKAYFLAFARVRGVGPARLRKLRERFDTLASAWKAPNQELHASGLDEKTVASLVETRKFVDPEKELVNLEKSGSRAITWDDAEYPNLLREVDNPPCVLWINGAFVDRDALAVAIVGTRGPSMYGKDVAAKFATQLAENGISVVSGLARGIDATAHEAALQAGGRTIAVLGSGVDVIYPPENRRLASQIQERGAVISEYPLGTKPDAMNFPPRNRIISGLSLAVLVVEADEKSGALITTGYAAEQGRDVFSIPGNIFSKTSRGTNKLIQQGAKLVTRIEDILDDLNLGMVASHAEAQSTIPIGDSETEQAILAALSGEPVQIDDLIRQTKISADEINTALTLLELKGFVRRTLGNSYALGRKP